MSHEQPLLLSSNHLNRGLFSDHYLDEVLPDLPGWDNERTAFTEAAAIRQRLLDLYRKSNFESLSESQLEDKWIREVLKELGHYWSVQVQIRYRANGYRKPDYVFTSTEADANSLTKRIYRPDELSHTLAVGDAKAWGVNLDRASGSHERNPSQQIDEYLRYSEIKWGILTDGRYWRLYERDSSKHNIFYAVDIIDLLEREFADEFFLYFFWFFRREAFVKDGWLDEVLQGSSDFAEKLSDQLEDEVYTALELIAEGFLDYRRNRLDANNLETLETIYESSLVLLYRLLFILYAECRDILPMTGDSTYANTKSLHAIKSECADLVDFHPTVLAEKADDSAIYTRLQDLFFAIDAGDPHLGIVPYNGRLFAESQHPFLRDHVVGTKSLAKAIDRLARIDSAARRDGKTPRVSVDYRDLSIRHLGAIYEKLLEFHLAVATEPLTVVKKKKTEVFVPAKGGAKVVKHPGEVYLRTGNNERKITGSYYTPDYIVTFIVKHAVEPVLLQVTNQHATVGEDGSWQVRNPDALLKAILGLNILDPATGSGHFMVEVVDQISKWLMDLDLRPVDIASDEDELTYWKRQVVTACIYGVDVNPLAIELAKLSLWLATIARGRPLSFLDHHAQLGNSLVGTHAAEIKFTIQPEKEGSDPVTLIQEAMFTETVGNAVESMAAIEHTVTADVADVKHQEEVYDQISEGLVTWRILSDVWTARYFGLYITEPQWISLYKHMTGEIRHKPLSRDLQTIVDEAKALSAKFHFFHWDLAFPEVFFDKSGQPIPDGGFDAIVGNPPYVR